MQITLMAWSVSRKNGGIFETVRRLGQTLRKNHGTSVDVIGIRDEFTDQDMPMWEPLPVRALKSWGPRSFGWAPGMARALIHSNCDILHLQGLWSYASIAALRWTRLTGRPLIVSPQGMLDPWAVRHSGWKKKLAYFFYEKSHMQSVACFHAANCVEAESMRKYGLRNPICIIPDGIDLPVNLPTCPPPWEGKVKQSSKVLLYLGRLHAKKNIPSLISALAILKGQNALADWVLVVAGCDNGDGHESVLKKLVRDQGLENEVLFVGPQYFEANEVCYHNADAFVLPSFSEGMPIAILQAWAFGKPVLMTSECNITEGFDAQAALQIGINPESIAAGLTLMIGLPNEERKAMGARGKALVCREYSWEKIACQMHAVYKWLARGDKKPEWVWVGE